MAQNFKKRKKTLFFAEKLYYQLGPALISISDFVKNVFFLVETEQKKNVLVFDWKISGPLTRKKQIVNFKIVRFGLYLEPSLMGLAKTTGKLITGDRLLKKVGFKKSGVKS